MRMHPTRAWRAVAMGMAGLAALLHGAAALATLATVDVNTAREADLDGIKGIGPALSARIVAERAKGRFQDWPDLLRRVKGIGPTAAARLSDNGLTLDGAAYGPAMPTPAPAPGPRTQ